MFPAFPCTRLADEVAVGSTAAPFPVLSMATLAKYVYCANVAAWIAQGIAQTVFTSLSSVFTTAAAHGLVKGSPVEVLLTGNGSGTGTTFTATNPATLNLTAHGFVDGAGPFTVTNSGGALPNGLLAATKYWVISTGANTFQLASSHANAIARASDITFSDNGSGTNKIVAVLPAGLTAATIYYAIPLTATTFSLATTYANALAGTAITTTEEGSGTLNVTTIATAGAGSMYVPANTPVLLVGSNGPALSVIQDSTGGKASLAPVSL